MEQTVLLRGLRGWRVRTFQRWLNQKAPNVKTPAGALLQQYVDMHNPNSKYCDWVKYDIDCDGLGPNARWLLLRAKDGASSAAQHVKKHASQLIAAIQERAKPAVSGHPAAFKRLELLEKGIEIRLEELVDLVSGIPPLDPGEDAA